MARNARPAPPSPDYPEPQHKDVTAGNLGFGAVGTLNAAQGLPSGNLAGQEGELDTEKAAADEEEANNASFEPGDFSQYIPLIKSNEEEQTVTGIVLVPEEVDGQGDVYDAAVIRKAAFDFLAHYNEASNLGMMHKDMDPPFTLCESYVAPCEMMIGAKTIKAGTWVMTVKVNDKKIWAMVKSGKITGFSIGGIAKVQTIAKA